MIYYLLVTDGTRVLMIQESKLVLPNTSLHWPITKKRPSHSWSVGLLKHITYGLYECSFEKSTRPFGFPVGQFLSICRLEPEKLETLFTQCTTIRRWSKYNGAQIGHKFSLLTIKDLQMSNTDLMSVHGLRYIFPDISSATMAEVPSNTITNDP